MRLQTPWIVAITIAVVIALSANSGDRGQTVSIFTGDTLEDARWHRADLPPDRWIGLVLDLDGWERLPAEIGVTRNRLATDESPSFGSEVAVVSYMGAMPTGGYSISLRDLEYTAFSGQNASRQSTSDGNVTGRITLHLAVRSPGPGDMVTQVFTYPASTSTISREAWPEGVLEAVAAGSVEVIAVDQDGRNWGPAHIVAGE